MFAEGLRPVNAALCMLLMTGFILVAAALPLVAAGKPDENLVARVNQLVLACQGGESLTTEQLREVAGRCDVLSEVVMKSDHPQKKLLLIRLGKSRNLCTYLLQLQQRE